MSKSCTLSTPGSCTEFRNKILDVAHDWNAGDAWKITSFPLLAQLLLAEGPTDAFNRPSCHSRHWFIGRL